MPGAHTCRRQSQRAVRTGVLVTALATVLGLALTALASSPAAATNVKVTRDLFGIHDATSQSFSTIRPGTVRLWDVGVQWRDIEVRRGHYRWARLDQLVTAAQKAHADVTMVVAMTPRFYAKKPTDPPGSVRPYKRFVHALMKRYRHFNGSRGISAYQVWNESNIATFYTGSVAKMAVLTRAMAAVRNNTDPHAKVIAPSMVVRLGYQQKGIESYYRQRVDGRAVWRYVDATSFSLYPMPRYGSRIGVPEDSIRLLRQVRGILHRDGVPSSKPLWNSEINYGLQSGSLGGTAATRISRARQAANVMRTYLLNAAAGVKRVYWYRYDWGSLPGGGTIGNTLLTDPSNSSRLLPVGKVYRRAERWMHGTLIGPSKRARPCQHNAGGTYTCIVRDSTGTRRIYWNPFRTGTVRLPRGVHRLEGVFGGVTDVRPRSTIKVGFAPVMVSR